MTDYADQITATDTHSNALSTASDQFVILMTERNALAAAHLAAEELVTELRHENRRLRRALETIRDGCKPDAGRSVKMGAKKARRLAADTLDEEPAPDSQDRVDPFPSEETQSRHGSPAGQVDLKTPPGKGSTCPAAQREETER